MRVPQPNRSVLGEEKEGRGRRRQWDRMGVGGGGTGLQHLRLVLGAKFGGTQRQRPSKRTPHLQLDTPSALLFKLTLPQERQ